MKHLSQGVIILGGGFKYFLFSTRTLGKMNPFWRSYFSDGLGKNHQLVMAFIVAFLFEAFWGLTLEDSGSDIGDEEVLQLQSARIKMDEPDGWMFRW